MVFQSYALYPHLTVYDNIAFPLKAQGVPRAEHEAKIGWAADKFGIVRLLARKPRELSGGERQRVALARALVRQPQVFLLDEPLSNLDAKLRASAREELQRFQKEIGTTAIYVTHDQVEAMALGDRVVIMDGGRVRQVGTPAEVYDDPADTFVATFLGTPPMNLLEKDGLVLGFRPEHVRGDGAGLPGSPARFRFRCDLTEYLGSERLAFGTLEDALGGPRSRLAVPVLGGGARGGLRPRRLRREVAAALLRRRHGTAAARRREAGAAQRWLGPALVAPAFAYIALLVGLPAVLSLYLSVSDARVGSDDVAVRRPRELRRSAPDAGLPRGAGALLRLHADLAAARSRRRDASRAVFEGGVSRTGPRALPRAPAVGRADLARARSAGSGFSIPSTASSTGRWRPRASSIR